MIKVKYNSPAIPQEPYNVDVKAIYNCEKNGDKYFIKGFNFDKEFSLNFIKMMFKPCEGYNWQMLDEKDENESKVIKSNTKPNNLKQKRKVIKEDGG